MDKETRWFRGSTITIEDVPCVGGKNASLGNCTRPCRQGVRVPNGIAVTAGAYRTLLAQATP
jgi:pyruvate,water dikinase